MTAGEEHFRKYTDPKNGYPQMQLEAICLVCSKPENSHLLTDGNDMGGGQSKLEKPPKIGTLKCHGGETGWLFDAWFNCKDFSRHEKRKGMFPPCHLVSAFVHCGCNS